LTLIFKDDAEFSKIGDDEGPEELTVRRVMQHLEKSSEKKKLKDKGLARVQLLAREDKHFWPETGHSDHY